METWIMQRPRGKEKGREEPEVLPEGERGRSAVGGMDSNMLCVVNSALPQAQGAAQVQVAKSN